MRGKEFYSLKDKAAEYVQRQKFDKAIQIYRSLMQDDPEDDALLLKLAHTYQLIGKEGSAIRMFERVLDTYLERKTFLQAIAVCRMILAMDPLHIRAQQQLVALYTEVYGGLPGKRGDTIMPPGFIRDDTAGFETVEDTQRGPSETGVEQKRSDSWSPVDIIFSNTDVYSPRWTIEDEGDEFGVDITDEFKALTDTGEVAIETESAEDMPLVERLAMVPMFSSVKKEDLKKIVELSQMVEFASNDFILKEGEHGDSFFVIYKGAVQILKGELMKPVANLGAGACFGEMALFNRKARRATVTAMEPTTLLEIERMRIDDLQRRYPDVRRRLRRCVRERLLDNLLMTSALFAPFAKELHARLRASFHPEEFIPFETIFAKNDPVGNLYLIVDGRAEMLLDVPERGRQLISTLGIGETFGEIPLLTDAPSTVTVRAKGRLSTLCLSREKFKSAMEGHPDIHHLVEQFTRSTPGAEDVLL
ncbi:MAG: cyclic nucleotide-binding domain-containing protein [Deltaproteobacteria bacterium]|nr:cyclic nucleotide-binding domain-containing protein [Deltaproteobacteria bacterium]